MKAVEFGDGFGICGLFGSQANDALYVENGEVKTKTNHNGGINGGITNGHAGSVSRRHKAHGVHFQATGNGGHGENGKRCVFPERQARPLHRAAGAAGGGSGGGPVCVGFVAGIKN